MKMSSDEGNLDIAGERSVKGSACVGVREQATLPGMPDVGIKSPAAQITHFKSEYLCFSCNMYT